MRGVCQDENAKSLLPQASRNLHLQHPEQSRLTRRS
jgi:hypothetical protein